MLDRIGKLVGGAVAATAVGLALAPVAGAAALPKAVDFWGMQPNALALRPGALGWTTDLGPSFNGTRGTSSGQGPSSNLSWSRWTLTAASGSGDLWVPAEHGQSISWTRYPARLSLSAPRTVSFATRLGAGTYRSSRVFTHVTVTFTASVPTGWRQSRGFALTRVTKGFYAFAFPR